MITRPASYLAVLAISSTSIIAGTPQTVFVNSGETLSESELLSGEFMGQVFDLGPTTIFQINTGGTIGPLGSSLLESPFSFGGSTVNLAAGSNFSQIFESITSYISNITMHVNTGSTAWNTSVIGSGAHVNIHGGFFLGHLHNGANLNITSGYLLAGTKAYDGSTITATGGILQSVDIRDGSILHSSDAEITNNFCVFAGSIATLVNTTVGVDAFIQNSTLSMTSGSIGDGLFLQGAQTVLDGVVAGNDARVRGGNLTIINSSIGNNFHMEFGTNVELVNGRIGDGAHFAGSFAFENPGILTVRGGSVGENLELASKATLDIYGGQFENILANSFGLTINLYVTSASLNGIELDLIMNDPLVITEREGALLEAILSDGSYFDLVLNDNGSVGEDSIGNNVLLTVTFIPAPPSLIMLSPMSLFAFRRRRR